MIVGCLATSNSVTRFTQVPLESLTPVGDGHTGAAPAPPAPALDELPPSLDARPPLAVPPLELLPAELPSSAPPAPPAPARPAVPPIPDAPPLGSPVEPL